MNTFSVAEGTSPEAPLIRAVGVHHVFNANEGEIDGCELHGALLTASDGAIYGTTIRGGTVDAATILRLRRVNVPPGQ